MSVNSCIVCGSPLPEGRGQVCSICLSSARTIPAMKQIPTPQKDPLRQYKGLTSKRNGEHFEWLILQACDRYRLRDEADIEKTPEPMKVLKDLGGGRFVACFTKAAQPDFKGITKGGRAVEFEAKYTDRDRMEQSYVTPEQEERLQRAYQYGAYVFVMVAFGLRDIYRIPWDVWSGMKGKYGRKYITPADVMEYRVSYSCDGKILLLEGLV